MNDILINIRSLKTTDALLTCITHQRPEDTQSHLGVYEGQSFANVVEGQRSLEDELKEALRTNGAYPFHSGAVLRSKMGWGDEGGMIQPFRERHTRPIKLNLDYRFCWLTPELMPVTKDIWLDQLGPIRRVLGHVSQRQTGSRSHDQIALVFQDDAPEQFGQIANGVYHSLQEQLKGKVQIDRYAGSGLSMASGRRSLNLQKIFTEHSCVVFIGHMVRSDNQGRHGWKITNDPADIVTMDEISDFLVDRSAVPEVVFACCCHSASSDPDRGDQSGFSYPKLFIDSGVCFYIGTSMDILFQHHDTARDFLTQFIPAFLVEWHQDPDNVVNHLYEAKKTSGFPLVSSLFQVYTTAGEEVREARGALVSAQGGGKRLGAYQLLEQVWGDPYARTFRAKDDHGCIVLVQVLADELQDTRSEIMLREAIDKLNAAELDNGHLIPTRYENLMLPDERCTVNVLVYERADLDVLNNWQILNKCYFDRSDPDHFARIIHIGQQISDLLAKLHRHGLVHGNLDLGNIILCDNKIMIKDAWVQHVWPDRCTRRDYAPPEELKQGQRDNRLNYDCWSMGVILFELATGQKPFEKPEMAGSGKPRSILDITGCDDPLADDLDCVIKECLVPATNLRPSADTIRDRLGLTQCSDGTYMSEFREELNRFVEAGNRLFLVKSNDDEQLLQTLRTFVAQTCPSQLLDRKACADETRYLLYILEPGRGLYLDGQEDDPKVPWLDNQAVHEMMMATIPVDRRPLPSPTPAEVDKVNGSIVLPELPRLSSNLGAQIIPIVLIRGSHWWNYGPGANRFMKMCQNPDGMGPVVIISDIIFSIDPDLFRSFVLLILPPPTPPVLFQRILDFPSDEGLGVPKVRTEVAVELSMGLFGSYWPQIRQILRACALKYGAIDTRVLQVRDELRDQEFSSLRGVKYTPVVSLPRPEHVALPAPVQDRIATWIATFATSLISPLASYVPRRLMIAAPDGCGKTVTAMTLGAMLKRPVVRIQMMQCVRGRLGDSEQALRSALAAINTLGGAVVLLDDIDHLLGPMGRSGEELTATLERMSVIVLDWLDRLPDGLAVVLTATHFHRLPDQWRRRCQLIFEWSAPVGARQLDFAYRQALFEALFRRFGLNNVARDAELTARLARETEPTTGIQNLRSPVARKSHGPLRQQTVRLHTCADIQDWVQETIRLHGDARSPRQREFWLGALE